MDIKSFFEENGYFNQKPPFLISLTFEQILTLEQCKSSRCRFLFKEEALARNYTLIEYEKGYKKILRIAESIRKNGYIEKFPIVIAYCKDDSKFYIIDGQTRKCACILVSEELSYIKDRNYEVKYIGEKTLKEIEKETYEYNNLPSYKWDVMDKVASNARIEGGQALVEFDELSDFMTKCHCGPTVARKILFNGRRSKFVNNYKIRKNCYIYLTNNAGKRINNLTEEKRLKFVSMSDVSYLFSNIYDFIEEMCKRYGLNYEEVINDVNYKIVEKINNISSADFCEVFRYNKTQQKALSSKLNLIQSCFHPILYTKYKVPKRIITASWNKPLSYNYYA